MIIVDTSDALLVSHRNNDQGVKYIVQKLKDNNILEGSSHKKGYRPWGNYLTIENGPNWQVKRIEVSPKSSLSLQIHNYRAEHWIVVSGEAFVEIDNKKFILKENQSTFIPVGSKHRLSNPCKEDLILIEVQSGTYLGEDDIIRLEDNYG